MSSSSGGTDLEAQFRLRLFALLGSSSALRQLVQSRSSSASLARLDLARFLAAYYLGINFSRLFERLNRCHQVEAVPSGGMATVLPNLMICAEMDVDDVEENIECHADRISSSPSSSSVWERSRLGQLLPCECTPNFALTLLLREQRCMEAVFFADHFHNSRTSMALRFLVDRHFAGLSLLAPYCRVTLIDQLLDVIELGEFDGDEKRIHQLIEAVIQADVLFHEEFGSCSLLNECLKAIASKMGAQFGELLHEHEVVVAGDEHHHSVAALQTPSIDTVKRVALLLPRPPIYCSSFELGMPLSARHDDADTETRAWAVLHACCTALVHALARSNRLEQLIGFFALWVGRHNDSTKSDVPFLLEAEFFTSGHSDAELAIELDAFQTLLSIALAMEIRDKFVRRVAESLEVATKEAQNANLANFNDVIRNCRDKLCALAPPFCDEPNKMQQKQHDQQLVWPSLKRWAQLAEQNDIESALLFLHTIQQQNAPTRRFLPPLNAQNRPKWRSLLLMDTSDNEIGPTNSNWVGHLEVFVGEEQKFKLVTTDFVRFRFLALRFQLVPLQDQPIQILLQLDPNEICSVVAGDEQHLLPAMNSFNSGPAKTEQRPTKTDGDNKCHHKEDGLSELIVQIRTSLAKLDERQTAGEELDYDLNLRQNDAHPDQEVHHEYSSGDEHVQLMRERLRDELVKRQKHQKKKTLISADSTSAYDGGPKSLSASRTSRSSGSSRIRTNRRRTSSNKMMRTNKKPSSASSSAAGQRNEEPSDDQLMHEMDTIGRRLDWIRQQFQQRTVVEQHIDGDGTPSLSEDTKFDNQSEVEAIGQPNTEEQQQPQPGNSTKSTSTEPRGLESGSLESEKLKARIPNKCCENAVNGMVNFENAESGGTEYGTAQASKNAEEPGMATSGTAEYSATGMARFENAETEMPKLRTYEAGMPRPENAEIGMPNSENAKFEMATLKLAETGQQSPVLAFDTPIAEDVEASCRSEVRQTPPSSAGYHSSRPSTSKTYDIYAENGGHNEAEHNANNNIFENWLNANVQTMPPPAVERMDFRGLRSSEEEEEVEDANLNVTKKPKRRLWREIEVFPRNSPTKVANQPAHATSECSKSMPKSSGERIDDCSVPEKPSVTEDAAQAAPRRSPWRRPQWLRLLPPFDGTIRTERQTAPIQLERPLLVLKLDELYTTPRGPEDAVETGGCNLTHPTRRRTFLELAAKMERMRRSQNSGTKVPKSKIETEQQQQPQTSGTYDSGIGLDQHQQQHNNTGNNNNINSNTNNGMPRNGVVLYSVELDEADVEAMRRRAGSDR